MDATVIHDGHIILDCNDDFCTLFRCTCAEVIGMQMQHIIHDPDLQKLALARGRRIMADSTGRVFEQDYDFRRCDNTSFWGRSISRRIGRDPDRYETKIKWKYDD